MCRLALPVRHLALLFTAVVLAACSDSGSGTPAPAANVTPVDPATAGSIAVTVGFSGAAPAPKPINMGGVPACAALHPEPVLDQSVRVANGKLSDVVVYIQSGFGSRGFAAPTEPVVIDQQGCLYHPQVAAVMVGQPLQFRNSDAEGHNVHGHPQVAEAWNFLMSRQGTARDVFFSKPELGIPVGCDIHPWMRAYVSVFDNPYFGVTGADGTINLTSVPPGDYVIGVWHPTLGALVKPVTLAPRGAATVEFAYQAPSGG
jgi:plastocyanin